MLWLRFWTTNFLEFKKTENFPIQTKKVWSWVFLIANVLNACSKNLCYHQPSTIKKFNKTTLEKLKPFGWKWFLSLKNVWERKIRMTKVSEKFKQHFNHPSKVVNISSLMEKQSNFLQIFVQTQDKNSKRKSYQTATKNQKIRSNKKIWKCKNMSWNRILFLFGAKKMNFSRY